jgi:hypothetical protein
LLSKDLSPERQMVVAWTVISVLLAVLLGWGLTLIGLNPPDFKNARLLCRISFASFAGWTVIWLALTKADAMTRIDTVIGVCLCSAIAFPICFNYIGRRERGENPAQTLAMVPVAPTADLEPKRDEEDLTVKDSDPRLMVEVKVLDDTGFPLIGIVLTNVGGAEAHGISVGPVPAHNHFINFPENIPVLGPGQSTQPIVPKVSDAGTLQINDMVGAMMKIWDNPTGVRGELLVFPAWAVYSDFRENKFRASWHFILRPYLYQILTTMYDNDKRGALRVGPYLTVQKITTERFLEVTVPSTPTAIQV